MNAERRVQIVECANCECQFDSTLPECPECADITEPLVCAAWKARAEAAEAALARVQACPRYAVYAIGRETTFIEQQDDGEFQYAADVRAALSPEATP